MLDSANTRSPDITLVVTILVLASSVSIMSTDMYAPSLPALANEFNTTPTRVKLTISLNLLAFGVAQLLHGPLSDRFGRRPVLLWSLAGVVLGCVLCVIAQSINQLIAARIFLGLVAAAEAVIGLAIIKDLFNERQQMKALALLGMVIAIVPAIAPILGGYLHVAFGWESNFLVIAGMAVVAAVAVYRYLPESTEPDLNALNVSRVVGAYGALLKNADFLSHTLVLGVSLGLIFVFVTAAPFILISNFGVPVHHFGYHQATIVASFFVGSFIASKLVDRWSANKLLSVGVIFIVFGCITLIVLISTSALRPYSLVAAYAIMFFGMGPLFAVAPSHALRSIKTQTGSASALLSGLEQSLAALSGVAVSVLHDGTAKPMAIVTTVLTLVLLILIWWIRRQNITSIKST